MLATRVLAQLHGKAADIAAAATTTVVASAAAAAASTTESQSPAAATHAPSIIAAGDIIKGVNCLKTGQDPVALADNEYPAWLWTITERRQTKFAKTEQNSREYLRFRRTEKIKMQNFMKARK